MELITQDHRTQMTANFADERKDHLPVVKLFCPWGAATWLLTGLCEEGALGFGLCDLGLGFPELGYVALSELRAIKGPFGLGIERDLFFEPFGSLEVYTEAARTAETITEDEATLRQAFAGLEARARREGKALKAFLAT
ncbi:DUF2958 domain-containing protein [Parvularcula oceani]|uniref:DUF2958 domain-containing protein n=1 Tax=Parvularcula oceani TaxID=1247963 RepID=UPI00068D26C7|nr:DUF2958 domain-containing protein [Parvularcula oceani]